MFKSYLFFLFFKIIGSFRKGGGGQRKSCPQAPAFEVDPRGFSCINVLQLVASIQDHHNYFVNEMRQPWSFGLGQVHFLCLQVDALEFYNVPLILTGVDSTQVPGLTFLHPIYLVVQMYPVYLGRGVPCQNELLLFKPSQFS